MDILLFFTNFFTTQPCSSQVSPSLEERHSSTKLDVKIPLVVDYYMAVIEYAKAHQSMPHGRIDDLSKIAFSRHTIGYYNIHSISYKSEKKTIVLIAVNDKIALGRKIRVTPSVASKYPEYANDFIVVH